MKIFLVDAITGRKLAKFDCEVIPPAMAVVKVSAYSNPLSVKTFRILDHAPEITVVPGYAEPSSPVRPKDGTLVTLLAQENE